MNLLVRLLPLLLLCAVATAQVTRIPNTGCVTEGYPQTTGTPSVGQTFRTDYFPAGRPLAAVVLAGVETTPMPVPVALTCGAVCPLAVNPAVIVDGFTLSVTIPNQPALVGACLVVQYGLIVGTPSAQCISVSGALRVCVMP